MAASRDQTGKRSVNEENAHSARNEKYIRVAKEGWIQATAIHGAQAGKE